EQCRGAELRSLYRCRTTPEAALFAGLSEGQQSDDIARRQRWIGAVRHCEVTSRAVEIDGDLVLLDGRGDFNVEDRINAKRIDEIDIATSEMVVVAAHSHLSGQQVNASKEDGVVPSAAHAHISFGLKSTAGPFQPCAGSGISLHVKLQVAQERRRGPRPVCGLGGRT